MSGLVWIRMRTPRFASGTLLSCSGSAGAPFGLGCTAAQVLFYLCPTLGKVVGLPLLSMVLEFPSFFVSQSFL